MTTVFIAGSIKIRKLHPKFVQRITNIVTDEMDVIVGDANGSDSSIQNELSRLMAQNVTVYCTGSEPRNNIGNWQVSRVFSKEKPGTRAFFTAKDLKMAAKADYGLMLWDTASTGTLSNVFELVERGKKCAVFIHKKQTFLNIKEPKDIKKLILEMSNGAKAQAEHKMNLNSRLSQLMNEQFGLAL